MDVQPHADSRYLAAPPAPHLTRPVVRLQPIQAKPGRPSIDLAELARRVEGVAELAPVIEVQSPDHWRDAVLGLGDEIDAILPISIPAYPTEVWNSHPQPLVERGLPVIFWPLIEFDEPDFWRWSARDMLTALGVDVHLVKSLADGNALLRALGVRRLLRGGRMVVFGEQNFPWNAHAAGHLIREHLGTELVVRTLADFRDKYGQFSDEQVDALWNERSARYIVDASARASLRQGLRTYLAIKAVLEEEHAFGMGVNCFGELVIEGGRDVPCLAQTLLREDGYIAACDGDFCAMMSMAMLTYLLDKPCMMSNMYPVSYVGALKDHFGGDPLSPDSARHPRSEWRNMARLAHCGYVGVVSPEMTAGGKALLKDWGGTWEIKRDGQGCGNAADLRANEAMTVVELHFDGRSLLLGGGRVVETTYHDGMPHCESSALLQFNDLEGFVENISREHTAIVYGDHIREMRILADVLGLKTTVR